MKFPWIKWFPADWLADSEIAKCTFEARGLWIEALNAMYISDTFALSGSPEDLSRILRCSVAEFHAGIKALTKTNAACHSERNGIVTLLSRRLERVHKSRELAKLRKQRSRQKKPSHAEVPSASASASASVSRERGAGKGDFPNSVEAAVQICSLEAIPASFVTHCFDKADSRGGRDAKGMDISNFRAYVRTEWKYEQERKSQQSNRAFVPNGRPPPDKDWEKRRQDAEWERTAKKIGMKL